MTKALLFHDYLLNSQKEPSTMCFKDVIEEAVQVTQETDHLKGDAEEPKLQLHQAMSHSLQWSWKGGGKGIISFVSTVSCSPFPSFALIGFGNRPKLLKAFSKTSVRIKESNAWRSLPITLTNIALLFLPLLLIFLCILHWLLFLNFEHVRATLWLATHLHRVSVKKPRQRWWQELIYLPLLCHQLHQSLQTINIFFQFAHHVVHDPNVPTGAYTIRSQLFIIWCQATQRIV